MLSANVGRICFVRLAEGDDLLEMIKKSAEENGMRAAAFTLIGALRDVVLGCYRNQEYVYTRLDGPLEIASCAKRRCWFGSSTSNRAFPCAKESRL